MDGRFRRRHLPHWDIDGAPYFVTACLAGSISAAGASELERFRRTLAARPRPATAKDDEWKHEQHAALFSKFDELLDYQPAVRHFDRPALSTIVRDAMLFFAGQRYQSIAWVVMPSHVHWMFQPLPAWAESLPRGKTAREVIMHGLKSFTANQCNRVLNRRGAFWQDESHDHWIRDESDLERVISYIEFNPVKAGLAKSPEEYEFSSAYRP